VWNYVDQANSGSGVGGYTDWRLANAGELNDLVNYGQSAPAIDGTTFPSTPSGYHWTSTTDDGTTTSAKCVDFSGGDIRTVDKDTAKHHVRLCRGGV